MIFEIRTFYQNSSFKAKNLEKIRNVTSNKKRIEKELKKELKKVKKFMQKREIKVQIEEGNKSLIEKENRSPNKNWKK